MPNRSIVLVAITFAALAGCAVPPTRYQPRDDAARGPFGYQSTEVEDTLIRVEFQGNARTHIRAVQAYAIYRAAEIARDSHAPAFALLEGEFDPQILEGSEAFSGVNGAELASEDFAVSWPERGDGAADRVVGSRSEPIVRTRGYAPVYVPTFIYVPSTPIVLPKRSLLVRLLPAIPAEIGSRVFVTQDVLDRLGPRIIRPDRK